MADASSGAIWIVCSACKSRGKKNEEAAKLNDVDPQAWLVDILSRLQDHPAKRIAELRPWNWKRERQQKAAA